MYIWAYELYKTFDLRMMTSKGQRLESPPQKFEVERLKNSIYNIYFSG